jgi:hypothetical protein
MIPLLLVYLCLGMWVVIPRLTRIEDEFPHAPRWMITMAAIFAVLLWPIILFPDARP